MPLVDLLLEFDIEYTPDLLALYEDQHALEQPAAKKERKVRGVTKREYARSRKSLERDEPVATYAPGKQQLAPYPVFREHQPKIAAFSQANPDNMAATLIFTVASQGVKWPDLVEWFPQIMEWIRRPTDMDGNKKNGLTPYPNDVPWKQVVLWGRPAINFLWRYRTKVYETIMRAIDEDSHSGNTGFCVYKKLLAVPGLGYPKAGFAAQLIVGAWGCVDSQNMVVVGSPDKISKKNAKGQIQFINPKSFIKHKGSVDEPDASTEDIQALNRMLLGHHTATGESNIKAYAEFLSRLQRDARSSACEQLWSEWCALVEYRIWHSGSPAPHIMADFGPNKYIGAPSKVMAYSAAKGNKRSANMDKAKADLERNPYTDPHTGKVIPYGSGNVVSRQHLDLVQSSMTPTQVVNRLLEAETMTLYYGSIADRGNDLQQGLRNPCLASTPQKARDLAAENGEDVSIYAVQVDSRHLVADDSAGVAHQHDWAASMRKSGTCFYRGTVAPNQIKLFSAS